MSLANNLASLEAVFGKQPPDKLAAYAIVLRHLPDSDLQRATQAAMRCCEFFPSPAKLMELARGHEPAALALPEPSRVHRPDSKGTSVLGRFRERGNALDERTYCGADLDGYPSRAMIAAKEDDPTYLTLHGNKSIEAASRAWNTQDNIMRRNVL